MRRFFIDPAGLSDTTAVLTGSEAHHIISVLRLEAGTPIQLFDGTGMVYQARIEKIDKRRVEAEIFAVARDDDTQATALHVGQAILKGKKMDFIVQKATELGVRGLHPFISRYCITANIPQSREKRQRERWQRIAREACKQCGRATPLTCSPTMEFEMLLSSVSASGKMDKKLIFWEEEKERTLGDVFGNEAPADSVMVLIGPEGGFDEAEVTTAVAAGFHPISLGRNTLRAETASVTAIAILQYLLGNLG